MTSFLEFGARAALCRQFARLEPDSKSLWLAEAERWSRLERQSGSAIAAHHDDAAQARGRENLPKRNPTEVRFEFRNAAEIPDGNAFEESLSGLLLEVGDPHCISCDRGPVIPTVESFS